MTHEAPSLPDTVEYLDPAAFPSKRGTIQTEVLIEIRDCLRSIDTKLSEGLAITGNIPFLRRK